MNTKEFSGEDVMPPGDKVKVGKIEFGNGPAIVPGPGIIPTSSNKQPHKCPICEGRGIVDGGFYFTTGEHGTSSTATEQCRSCNGIGIIWG